MAIMVDDGTRLWFRIVTGEEFPDLNEDLVRLLGDTWRVCAKRLRELVLELRSVVARTRSDLVGEADRAFVALMAPFVEGTDNFIDSAADFFGMLSTMLCQIALDGEHMKYIVILELDVLAAEFEFATLAQLIWPGVWAWFSGRYQMIATIVRMVVAWWRARLAVLGELGVAGKIAQIGLQGLVVGTPVSLVNQVGVEAAAEALQSFKGTRAEWSRQYFSDAAVVGSFGGLLAPVAHAGGHALGKLLAWLLDKAGGEHWHKAFLHHVTHVMSETAHEGSTEFVATAALTGQAVVNWAGFTAGASSGVARVSGHVLAVLLRKRADARMAARVPHRPERLTGFGGSPDRSSGTVNPEKPAGFFGWADGEKATPVIVAPGEPRYAGAALAGGDQRVTGGETVNAGGREAVRRLGSSLVPGPRAENQPVRPPRGPGKPRHDDIPTTKGHAPLTHGPAPTTPVDQTGGRPPWTAPKITQEAPIGAGDGHPDKTTESAADGLVGTGSGRVERVAYGSGGRLVPIADGASANHLAAIEEEREFGPYGSRRLPGLRFGRLGSLDSWVADGSEVGLSRDAAELTHQWTAASVRAAAEGGAEWPAENLRSASLTAALDTDLAPWARRLVRAEVSRMDPANSGFSRHFQQLSLENPATALVAQAYLRWGLARAEAWADSMVSGVYREWHRTDPEATQPNTATYLHAHDDRTQGVERWTARRARAALDMPVAAPGWLYAGRDAVGLQRVSEWLTHSGMSARVRARGADGVIRELGMARGNDVVFLVSADRATAGSIRRAGLDVDADSATADQTEAPGLKVGSIEAVVFDRARQPLVPREAGDERLRRPTTQGVRTAAWSARNSGDHDGQAQELVAAAMAKLGEAADDAEGNRGWDDSIREWAVEAVASALVMPDPMLVTPDSTLEAEAGGTAPARPRTLSTVENFGNPWRGGGENEVTSTESIVDTELWETSSGDGVESVSSGHSIPPVLPKAVQGVTDLDPRRRELVAEVERTAGAANDRAFRSALVGARELVESAVVRLERRGGSLPGFRESGLAREASHVVAYALTVWGERVASARAESVVTHLYRMLLRRELTWGWTAGEVHRGARETEGRYTEEEYVRAGTLVGAAVADLRARGGFLEGFDRVERGAFEVVARVLHTSGLELAAARAVAIVRGLYLELRGPEGERVLAGPVSGGAVWTVPRIREEAAGLGGSAAGEAVAGRIVDMVLRRSDLRAMGVVEAVIGLVASRVNPELLDPEFRDLHENVEAIALAASIGRDLGVRRSDPVWYTPRLRGGAEPEATPPAEPPPPPEPGSGAQGGSDVADPVREAEELRREWSAESVRTAAAGVRPESVTIDFRQRANDLVWGEVGRLDAAHPGFAEYVGQADLTGPVVLLVADARERWGESMAEARADSVVTALYREWLHTDPITEPSTTVSNRPVDPGSQEFWQRRVTRLAAFARAVSVPDQAWIHVNPSENWLSYLQRPELLYRDGMSVRARLHWAGGAVYELGMAYGNNTRDFSVTSAFPAGLADIPPARVEVVVFDHVRAPSTHLIEGWLPELGAALERFAGGRVALVWARNGVGGPGPLIRLERSSEGWRLENVPPGADLSAGTFGRVVFTDSGVVLESSATLSEGDRRLNDAITAEVARWWNQDSMGEEARRTENFVDGRRSQAASELVESAVARLERRGGSLPGFRGSGLAREASHVVAFALGHQGEILANVRAESVVTHLYRMLLRRELTRGWTADEVYRGARETEGGYRSGEYARAGVLVQAAVFDLQARGGFLEGFDRVERGAFEVVARVLHTSGLELAAARAVAIVRGLYLESRGPEGERVLAGPVSGGAVWTVPRIQDEGGGLGYSGVAGAVAGRIVDMVLRRSDLHAMGVVAAVIGLVASRVNRELLDPEFRDLHENVEAIALAASIGRDLGVRRSDPVWYTARLPGEEESDEGSDDGAAVEEEPSEEEESSEGSNDGAAVEEEPSEEQESSEEESSEGGNDGAAVEQESVMRAATVAQEGAVLRGGGGRLVHWRDSLWWVGSLVSPEFLAELSASVSREVIAIAVGPGANEPRWWRFPPVRRPLPVKPEDLPPDAQAALAELERPGSGGKFGNRA